MEDRVKTSREYLSLKELCERIPYDDQTIRNLMTQGKLLRYPLFQAQRPSHFQMGGYRRMDRKE